MTLLLGICKSYELQTGCYFHTQDQLRREYVSEWVSSKTKEKFSITNTATMEKY